ncbi:MAG: Killer protein [Candidatus Melainabacteria bacterium GWF2_37_15]|nr:MAG: Killer protein [Candidatus Melainabacteria bacterium GWF2_37_15]
MIKSFKHKGLEKLFTKGDPSKINPNHIKRIKMILGIIHRAKIIDDINFPGSRLHPHKGNENIWSVDVSGNYRIIFKFIDGNAYILDYKDPH